MNAKLFQELLQEMRETIGLDGRTYKFVRCVSKEDAHRRGIAYEGLFVGFPSREVPWAIVWKGRVHGDRGWMWAPVCAFEKDATPLDIRAAWHCLTECYDDDGCTIERAIERHREEWGL